MAVGSFGSNFFFDGEFDEIFVFNLAAMAGGSILFQLSFSNYLQKKYWTKLKAEQKVAIMDILLSMLEFASSYNSSANLRTRMHQISDER